MSRNVGGGRQLGSKNAVHVRLDAERHREPTVNAEELRARIETNLRVYERRDDEFSKGKAAGFRVVLGMLDGPAKPTFVCGRPGRDDLPTIDPIDNGRNDR